MVAILNRHPRLSYGERNGGRRLSGAQVCFVGAWQWKLRGREYQCSDPVAAGGKLVGLALESGRMAEQGEPKSGLEKLSKMKSPFAFKEENILSRVIC